MNIRIRRMGTPDVTAVAGLERRIFSDAWSHDAFRAEVTGRPTDWPIVAEVEKTGEIAGYLIAWFVADEVHLANIAVPDWFRRKGIGQKLMDSMVEEGRRRGARMVVLEVRRSNDAAQALYRRNGFYPVTVRRAYYRDNREDALVMIKPLNDSGRIAPDPELDA